MYLVKNQLDTDTLPLWFLVLHKSKFQTRLASRLTSPESYGSALHICVFDMRRRYWWKLACFHPGNLIVVHITMQCILGGGFMCFFQPENWGKNEHNEPILRFEYFRNGLVQPPSSIDYRVDALNKTRSLWSSQTWAPMPMLCERQIFFIPIPSRDKPG